MPRAVVVMAATAAAPATAQTKPASMASSEVATSQEATPATDDPAGQSAAPPQSTAGKEAATPTNDAPGDALEEEPQAPQAPQELRLPVPHADDQTPSPALPAASGSRRDFALGAFAGIMHRPSRTSAARYSAGPWYGGFARFSITEWLATSLGFGLERHAVDVPDRPLDGVNTSVSQDDIDGTSVTLLVEPTWHANEVLFARVVAGVGWTRLSASPVEGSAFSGQPRDGQVLQYPLAVAAGVSPWDRVTIELGGGVAWLSHQNGTLFSTDSDDRPQTTQGISRSGALVAVEGLPRFATSYFGALNLTVAL